jgi:dienelactone hydrolase
MARTIKTTFLMAAVFLLSAFDTVKFDNAKMDKNDVVIERIFGMLFQPSGNGPFPAVVLLHTCGGVMPHVSRDWPNYLTKLGYVVLTVDSFGSRNVGNCPNGVGSLKLGKDGYGARDYLEKQPFVDGKRIAVIGFSWGARAINDMLTMPPPVNGKNFQAAISFYGRCDTLLGMESDVQIPLLQIFGDKDEATGDCDLLDEDSKIEFVKLPNTHHFFDSEEGSGKRTGSTGVYMEYNGESLAKAREITKNYLIKHLGK